MAEKRRPAKLFAELFQISAVSLQGFPNKALAVLWDFKRLQGLQAKEICFQIYSPRRPPFGLVPNANRAVFRRLAS